MRKAQGGSEALSRAPATALALTAVRLTNFRSYEDAALAVEAAPVVLAGPNGTGKTNLLEAISLLSPGRGLRGAKLSEHPAQGARTPQRRLVGGSGHRRAA